MLLNVAIVGRPNVGKSTLFNRLVGKRVAIVAETPGVTRDRRDGVAKLGPLRFGVTDTAGWEHVTEDSLTTRMMEQTQRALSNADIVLLVVDGRNGITSYDHQFANLLRRQEKPVVLLVNKCEGDAAYTGIAESYRLGLGDPIIISAEHNQGIDQLYDVLAPLEETVTASAAVDSQENTKVLHLAIVGRPNVGKSTLLNKLIGDDRVITGPEAGITRDSVKVKWSFRGQNIELVDTAGLRRRSRVSERLEELSNIDTHASLGLAEVVLLLFDATVPPVKQDLNIADVLAKEGRAPVIIMNKWDKVDTPHGVMQDIQGRLEHILPDIRGVPVVSCSALTGKGCKNIMPAVLDIYKKWNFRISTSNLNRWLAIAIESHAPPLVGGRRIKLRYITQVKSRPPTFAAFVNRPEAIADSYRRYLINSLREKFSLDGIPIRLVLRRNDNPYV